MTSTVTRAPHQVYRLSNGTKVPGVTTILRVISKEALPPWANRLGFEGVNSTEYLRHVADAGTLSHAMIAQELGGDVADYAGYTPDQVAMAERALSGFQSWAAGKILEAREIELSLVSEGYQYGGTLDALLLVDGAPTLIDFKTSSAIYDDHCYQLAAYHQLLVEAGHEVAEARIVRLSRDAGGEYSERVIPASGLEPYFAVFLAALSLHNAIKLATKRRARRW